MGLTETAQASAAIPNYTPQLLTGLFALLGVTLGFLLQRWSKAYDDKKKLRTEWNALKMGFIFDLIENNYVQRLYEIKKFFTDHPDVIPRSKTASKFFMRWLMNQPAIDAIAQTKGAVNVWNAEAIQEMKKELAEVIV